MSLRCKLTRYEHNFMSKRETEALFNDERLEWIKDHLVLGLSLQDVPREQLVEVLTKFELADFLNGRTTHTSVIFTAVDRIETVEAQVEQDDHTDDAQDPDPEAEHEGDDKAETTTEETAESTADQPAESTTDANGESTTEAIEEEEEEEEEEDRPHNLEVKITDLNFYFNDIPSIPETARVMAFYSLIGSRKAIPRDRTRIHNTFSFQVLPVHCLKGLADSLNSVYSIIFSSPSTSSPESPESDPLSSGVDPDFLSVFQKFVDEINHSVRKLQTTHEIVFPEIQAGDPARLAQNSSYTESLEYTLDKFTSLISKTIDQLSKQQHESPGPLAEVELWRSRYIVSSSLLENLKSPLLPSIISVLDQINSQSVPNFNAQLDDLDRYVKESKSNVDFLTLLERHFRQLSTAPLQTVYNSISSIMDSLRLIWITSNYYNTDTLMAPLIERISHQLCDRVQSEIRTTMLHGDLDEAIAKTQTAESLLTQWHEKFNETRSLIERSNHSNRWDFELPRLFERPVYIADRCKELIQIAEKLRELYSILGPELKSITNTPHVIDETKKQVDDLITPLDPLPFELFDKRLRSPWEACLSKFLTSAHKIQEQLSAHINKSFKDLRSCEAGLDLLDRFKNIKLAGDMKEQMEFKIADVLAKYMEEVEAVDLEFKTLKNNPPILNHHYPVTGRIAWGRSLFILIKKPILRLKQQTNSKEFTKAKMRYAEVAKTIDKHNHSIFEEFCVKSEVIAKSALEKPILIKTAEGKYKVNFDKELTVLIGESKYLERMGFSLPRDVVNVLLQYPHYRRLNRNLEKMLDDWEKTNESIGKEEIEILSKNVKVVESVFEDGIQFLNWNSLGVHEFLIKCQRAIHQFKSAANSVSSNASKIFKAVKFIGDCVTLPDTVRKSELSDFLTTLNKFNESKQKEINSQINDIPPQLRIIEGATMNSALTKKYNEMWDFKIKNAIERSKLLSMIQFEELLKEVVLKMEARLAGTRIDFYPAIEAIERGITKILKEISLDNSEKVKIENHIKSTLQKVTEIEDTFAIGEILNEDSNTLKNFRESKPSVGQYDDRILRYEAVINQIKERNPDIIVNFIEVDTQPVLDAIVAECHSFIKQYCSALHADMIENLNAVEDYFKKITADLKKTLNDKNDLEYVLSSISELKANSCDLERKIEDIHEKSRTLQMHSFKSEDPSQKLLLELSELQKNSKDLDESLIETKENFKKVSIQNSIDFIQKVEVFQNKIQNRSEIKMEEGLAEIIAYKQELNALLKERDDLHNAEKLFELPLTPAPQLMSAAAELAQLQQIYELYDQQTKTMAAWGDLMWADVDVAMLSSGLDGFELALRKLPRELRGLGPYEAMRNNLSHFRESLPVFSDLKSDALRERHWAEMLARTGVATGGQGSVTLADIFKMDLVKYADSIGEITATASKELAIERGIDEIADTWSKMKMNVISYKQRGLVLSGVDDMLATLEDNRMKLQSLSSSRFVAHFSKQVREWEISLSQINDLAAVWLQVQMKWMYLEGIFIGSEDIQQQLERETAEFKAIDSIWLKLMSETKKNSYLLSAAKSPDRLSTLQNLLQRLDRCQHSLSEYLESKRVAFPRFYFISDDELLSMLGSSGIQAVQPHVIKLFGNTESLMIKQGKASGMVSSEGESFEFKQLVAPEGAVEDWMAKVEAEMRRTLKQMTREAVVSSARDSRIPWIRENLGMCVITAGQIWWTYDVEDAFRQVRAGNKHAMKQFRTKLIDQLSEIVSLIRTSLDGLTRKKINTLIIVDVHSRDLVDGFVRDSVLDQREFQWESQLRFYWDRSADDVVMRQCTGEFLSGHEYMGLSGRLVITPLTDRCIMTLTQALAMGFGGSPAGPAGTGKTETVKDLAKAMCRLCNVFNCGEGLDHKSMARIFSGLVQTGGWGCFDEFNRIEPEVLSVISGQIRVIQAAFKAGVRQFVFENRKIPLNPGFGIFITMNPGYAGRSELPDNLKAMFRPVVMVVPDKELICEVMLFSEGFETNTHTLAKKMIAIYDMAAGQLSRQHHYDWGLRALKSVLTRAGELKRKNPNDSEQTVLMAAIKNMNMPKFTFEDTPLFIGLLGDLFPDVEVPPALNDILRTKAAEILAENNFQPVASILDKIVQLHETMGARHTTMIVGATGGGKSVVIDTLAKTQTRLGTLTKLYTLNPKACTVAELYGVLDPTTRDWKYGLFSKIFKDINQNTERKEARYIVFDGDVDAVWVENMNSVMDDNKLLTLANSERIRLLNHCALLFEVGDLKYASPATVSRCGMVFMDPRSLGSKPFFERWLATTRRPEHLIFLGLCEKYVEPCETFCKGLEKVVSTTNLSMTRQLCSLLDYLLPEGEVRDQEVLESIFVFAVVWSFGANLAEESQIKFDRFIKVLTNWVVIDAAGRNARAGQLPGTLPTLFDFAFIPEQSEWVSWASRIKEVEVVNSNVIVPTVDTARNDWLLRAFSDRAVLLIGKSGTAKTATVTAYQNSLDPEKYSAKTLNFSNRTTSLDVQQALEESLDFPTKDTAVPQGNKEMKLFIDDVNMPTVDKYGTQQPIALLKLLIERGGMYERGGDLTWRTVSKISYIAAMAPPGGARATLDPRFVSLFSTFHVVSPSDDSIRRIFSVILGAHLKPFAEDVRTLQDRIVNSSLALYKDVVSKLPPTPSKFHYLFNLRDLSRIFEGLCKASPGTATTATQLIRLWRNESLRVFHDRLTNIDDRKFVSNKITSLIEENFPSDTSALRDPIVYGDFVNPDESVYKDLGEHAALLPFFTELLEDYAIKKKAKVSLVLFDYVLEHLTRILRVIRTPRGNALLIGVGGSGKKSLARLAAFAAGYEIFEVTLTSTYGEKEFRDDLHKLYNLVGVERKQVVFLFSDAHVVDESFLELVNNILTSGVVPALFASDEKEQILASMRESHPHETPDALWRLFIDRCRDNLHVVLCFSPSGDSLRRRCRDFPGLVSSTIIDWFDPWPGEALQAVSKYFVETDLDENEAPRVTEHMVVCHTQAVKLSHAFASSSRRAVHVTPTNFLEYISTFRKQLAHKKTSVQSQLQVLSDGLKRLVSAQKEVEELDVQFKAQQTTLLQTEAANNAILERATAKKIETDAKMQEASTKESEIKNTLEEVKVAKAAAEQALREALPIREKAAAAVAKIDPKEYAVFRTMPNPPGAGAEVGKLLCALFNDGDGDESWAQARAYMSRSSFLAEMKDFKVREKCQSDSKMRHIKAMLNSLKIADVERAGLAATIIYEWCVNIYAFYEVDKEVIPKESLVAQLEANQRRAQADFARIQRELQAYQEELKSLEMQLQSGRQKQDDLQRQKDKLERRLNAAQRLISGFGSEQQRWTEDMANLRHQLECVVGDCLLSAAFFAYLGPLNQEYRSLLLSSLREDLEVRRIRVSGTPLHQFLADDAEVFAWRGEGLPADELSIQNGLLITRAARFPLCIDPQAQVVRWIKAHVGEKQLRTTSFQDPEFPRIVENAIQYGMAVLFEGIDEFIDPLLTPVLERAIVQTGSRRTLKFNDKELDYDDNFRLFMTTKLSSPGYSPEVASRVSLVNCCVTETGLEEQLLDIVIAHEHADKHQEKTSLVKQMSENKARLQTLQRILLKRLSESTGYITDNEQLLATLEETKAEAADIAQKLERASITSAELDALSAEFAPVARRGSTLFFSMTPLSAISTMYEYSLASFSEVFAHSLRRSAPTPVVSKRIAAILTALTRDVFDYVLTSLFERHKLMYAFHMAVCIAREQGKIDQGKFEFLIKGNTSLAAVSNNPYPKWLPDAGWHDIIRLATIAPFESILGNVKDDEKSWQAFYEDLVEPEYMKNMTQLERMCVLRCFRPDRIWLASRDFVIEQLGNQFARFPIVSYQNLFEQSSPSAPVLFILSPGADPASELFKLAEKLGMVGDERTSRVRTIALGQDQDEPAVQMLQAGASRGHWVVLQNCHLLTGFLKELEKLIEKLSQRPHPDFRVWLTSDPTPYFPVGLLQRATKVVTEPPSGLQLNMRQSFATITDEQFGSCEHFAFKPLVYVLAFFHAVVQERRKYGKIGWNVPYDFNHSDFSVSLKLLSTYLGKAIGDVIPWGSLRYLIGEAMYGGRVTDQYDRRVLMTYLDEYMGDFLFDEFQVFHFFKGDGVSYDLPSGETIGDFVNAIDSLPNITTPDVFGLDRNAEVTFYNDSSRLLCQNLVSIHSKSASSTGINKESSVAIVATEIQLKLKPLFNLEEVRASFGSETTPVQVVLVQELEHWNALVSIMSVSLAELQRAIAGEVPMSNDLESLMDAIHMGRLPEMWAHAAPETEKALGGWLEHFEKRYEQYEDWYKNGEPKVMWLAGLHVPEAYLTALLQTACRSKGWPLDRATLMISVSTYQKANHVMTKPSLGCYLSGMYLEGAAWDSEKRCLVQQKPKELVVEMPLLKVTPIEMNKVRTQNTLKTPVYLTQKRRDSMGVGYVTDAYLETTEHTSFWVLRGVAITMNIR